MVKQKITPLNKSVRQTHLSRLFFLSKGCKQVPLRHTKNIVRWGHPDGYFLNAIGQKIRHNFPQRDQKSHATGSASRPKLRECVGYCHILMAIAFYGERPIFIDRKGKAYYGYCHHLIPDPLDYKPANLLCWLTREQHAEADRRQRLIKKAVGIEGMREIGYEQLRIYQDPREISAVDFELWLIMFKED